MDIDSAAETRSYNSPATRRDRIAFLHTMPDNWQPDTQYDEGTLVLHGGVYVLSWKSHSVLILRFRTIICGHQGALVAGEHIPLARIQPLADQCASAAGGGATAQ